MMPHNETGWEPHESPPNSLAHGQSSATGKPGRDTPRLTAPRLARPSPRRRAGTVLPLSASRAKPVPRDQATTSRADADPTETAQPRYMFDMATAALAGSVSEYPLTGQSIPLDNGGADLETARAELFYDD